MFASGDVAIPGLRRVREYVPGTQYVDWPTKNPEGQDDATLRRILAEIDTHVRDLLVALVPDIELPPSALDQE